MYLQSRLFKLIPRWNPCLTPRHSAEMPESCRRVADQFCCITTSDASTSCIAFNRTRFGFFGSFT